MNIDYTTPIPNKESTKAQNIDGDFLTIVREMDNGYLVRVTQTNEETGERSERTDFIARELFESCVKTGYLQKIIGELER